MRNLLLAGTPVLLAVLTGCGGDSGAGAAPAATTTVTVTVTAEPSSAPPTASTPALPARVDACTLLTHAEAQSLARTPLEKPVRGNDPENPSCAYGGPVSGPLARVEIFVGAGARKYYDIDRGLGSKLTRIAGIGDECHLKASASTIYFRKATTWVVMRVVRLEDEALFVKPLQTQARRVVARL